MRVAGLMSGTSLDGIDVAVVEINGRRVETIGFACTAYSEEVRSAILDVSNLATFTGTISRLNFQLGELYARAVLRAVRRYGPVELIGCHGQTIYHEGGAHTLQIGEAAVVAERTGVPVVSNFRARDIAAGGQGAPLVPYVDYLLFRHPQRTRIALNIGGIANITVIPAGAAPGDVVAFDTGPGNMVIDALAREMGLPCDRGGKIAASGQVNRALLDELLADPYYRNQPPKSAGREQYGARFVARLKESGLPMPDLMATATVLTAATVAHALLLAGVPSWGRALSRNLAKVASVHSCPMATGISGEFHLQPMAIRGEFSAAGDVPGRDRPPLMPARSGAAERREARNGSANRKSRRGTQECVRHPTDLIVSGGGVHNPQIMAHLAGFLPGIAISTSTGHGIDADAKEAIAFAVLAYRTWRKRPSNLPSATGARHAAVLGSITL